MLQCLSNRLLLAASLVYLQIVPHCPMSADCAVLCKCRMQYNAKIQKVQIGSCRQIVSSYLRSFRCLH